MKILLKKILIYFKVYTFFPKDLVGQFRAFKIIFSNNKTKNFKNVVDIGANSGNWTLLFKSLFPKAEFFMVEADKVHLKKICRLSKYHTISALYKKDTKKIFYKYESFNGTGNSFYKEKTNIKYQKKIVHTKTLDNVIKRKFNRSNYDLIKIDTQGSELDILRGAKKTLKKTKFLILEVQNESYNLLAPNYKKVEIFLKKNRFKKFRVLYKHYKNKKKIQSDILYSKF